MQPSDVSAWRDRYRAEQIPPGYSGPRHAAWLAIFIITGIAIGVWQLEAVQPLEWLAVPVTFLYANLAEYLGHRFVMHRRRPGLGLIHERHTLQHHRFFMPGAMSFDSSRDWKAVLFPPLLVAFFFVTFALPVALLVGWLWSPNVAWLFLITALVYYASYEILHFAWHLPESAWWLRLPEMRRLRQLHLDHHDPSYMSQGNFNITWPICDWLFGTRLKPGTDRRPLR